MARRFSQPRAGASLLYGDALANGLRLYVPAFEGAGRTCANLVSGSHGGTDGNTPSNVTFQGTPTWGSAAGGYALSFSGSPNYAQGNPWNWAASQPATISLWFQCSAGQGSPLWGSGTTATTALFRVYPAFTDNNIYWDYGNNTGNGRLSTAFPTDRYNKWNNVVCVSAGVNGAFRAIYLNGVLRNSATASQSPVSATTFFTWGRFDNLYWSGLSGNLAVWNRVLSPSEIYRLWAEPYCLVREGSTGARLYAPAVTAFTGTSAVTAPAATLTASGTVVNAYTGTSAVTAAAATLTASGTVVNPAAGFGSNLQLLGIG